MLVDCRKHDDDVPLNNFFFLNSEILPIIISSSWSQLS